MEKHVAKKMGCWCAFLFANSEAIDDIRSWKLRGTSGQRILPDAETPRGLQPQEGTASSKGLAMLASAEPVMLRSCQDLGGAGPKGSVSGRPATGVPKLAGRHLRP